MDVEGSGAGRGGWVLNGCRAAALIEEERVEGNEWMVDDKPAPNRRDGRSKRERCARRARSAAGSGRKRWQTCGSSVRTALCVAGGMYTGISCTSCSTSIRSQFMICP